jgi:pimeloyl-ACP methyl ester carboxylesterase
MILDQGEGPVVVLLHGGEASPSWGHLAAMLAARCRVLMPENVADPLQEIDEAGVERFAIVGEAEGAMLALDLATSDRVDALVLLSPTHAPETTVGNIPVLIFAGEADAHLADVAESLNEAIPTSTLGLVPGVGADLLDEAAATLFPMIDEYLRARFVKAPHGHGADGIVTIQLERKPAWVEADDEEDE